MAQTLYATLLASYDFSMRHVYVSMRHVYVSMRHAYVSMRHMPMTNLTMSIPR